jgi:Methyltransferase domain
MGVENSDVVTLIRRYYAPDGAAAREHNARDGSLGFGAIHYALVVNLRPERALVIGSRHGYIPATIALALKFNGAGVLDFVDANYSDVVDGFGTAYGGVGHWEGDSSTSFEPLHLRDNVRVHIMRSSQFFTGCDARYGYIYLDGDHSYEGCRYDFEQAAARAEDGAIIAVHDIAVTEPSFGVGRLFAELDDRHFGKLRIAAWPGLGLLQVRKPPE